MKTTIMLLLCALFINANCQDKLDNINIALETGEYFEAENIVNDIIKNNSDNSYEFHIALSVQEELKYELFYQTYLEYFNTAIEYEFRGDHISSLSFMELIIDKLPQYIDTDDARVFHIMLKDIYEYLSHYESDNNELASQWTKVNEYIKIVK